MSSTNEAQALQLQADFTALAVPPNTPHSDSMHTALAHHHTLATTLDTFPTWTLSATAAARAHLEATAKAAENANQAALRHAPQTSAALLARLLDRSEHVLLALEALLPPNTLTLFATRVATIQREYAVLYPFVYRRTLFGEAMRSAFEALEALARYLDRFPACDLGGRPQRVERIMELAGELEVRRRRLAMFLGAEECVVMERMVRLAEAMWIRVVLVVPAVTELWGLGYRQGE